MLSTITHHTNRVHRRIHNILSKITTPNYHTKLFIHTTMATSSAGSSQYTSTAVRVHEPGDSSVLRVDIDIPMAECGPNDVLVEIAYAGLNFIDCYQRSGLYPMKYPFVLGKEGSGIVRHIGSDVRTIHTGDRVGVMSQSTYATYTVAAEKDIVKLPDSVLLSDAAAVLLQGLTAHYLTHSTYPLKSGDICLTHASAGGTSALIVQMAKLRGATVIATAGSEAKCAIAKSLGADHVINYSETDFQSEVMRITNNKGVQVVYDGVGKSTWEKSMKSLSKLGHLVLFGNASGAGQFFSLCSHATIL